MRVTIIPPTSSSDAKNPRFAVSPVTGTIVASNLRDPSNETVMSVVVF